MQKYRHRNGRCITTLFKVSGPGVDFVQCPHFQKLGWKHATLSRPGLLLDEKMEEKPHTSPSTATQSPHRCAQYMASDRAKDWSPMN